jgi:outer membrane autotransporter protein
MFQNALRTLALSGCMAAAVMHVTPAAACNVTGISPANGSAAGGTSVTIAGSFNGVTVTGVKFGSTPATLVTVTNTTITVISPPGSGTVNVIVIEGNATSNAVQFTYAAPVASAPADTPADSLKLRALQIAAAKIAAQGSGQSITGAIEDAVDDDLNNNHRLISPTGSGIKIYFTKGPPWTPPPEWRVWADVRGTAFNRGTSGDDLHENQINATAGLTRKLTPNFLVGLLAGYENFDYTSQALGGRLKGDGWAVGGYSAWRFAPHLRLDAAVARAGLNYEGVAGTSAATFPGNRWLVSGGVTGTYNWRAVVLEPSARLYALWEREGAYTDNLGTAQAERSFSGGRFSAGTKVTYPIAWSVPAAIAPYLGLYGDYYFSRDDADTLGLPSIPVISGWSARVAAGIGMSFARGAQLSIGGELGGLGGDHTLWAWRARGSLPF